MSQNIRSPLLFKHSSYSIEWFKPEAFSMSISVASLIQSIAEFQYRRSMSDLVLKHSNGLLVTCTTEY